MLNFNCNLNITVSPDSFQAVHEFEEYPESSFQRNSVSENVVFARNEVTKQSLNAK